MSDTPKSSPILRLDNALPKKELAKIRDNFSAIVSTKTDCGSAATKVPPSIS